MTTHTTIRRCHACDVEKDMHRFEVYPYGEQDGITDSPIEPLMTIHAQGTIHENVWKEPCVCHACFHKLDVDMWISEDCWMRLKPTRMFMDLPDLDTE